MTGLAHDLRFAWRSLRKTPVFTAVALLSLALGIGANTAIFTLIDQLILRLLPVRDPQQIVLLAGRGRHYGGNNGMNALSYLMYQDLRDRNQVFSQMMCRYRLNFTLDFSGNSEVAVGELVSGNYFPLLGVGAAAGRVFTAAGDLRQGAHPYAVLSYAYWQTRFAGNRDVIGQRVLANNYPLTIVGIARPGFDGTEPGLPAKIFVPVSMAPSVRPGFGSMWDRRQRWVNVYGRLKPGMTIERAKAGLQPLFHQIIEWEVKQPPFRNATVYDKEQFLRMWLDVMPGSQGNTNLRRTYEKPLLVLIAVTGLVLLIACANLASLLTARASARQKEIAVRLAIGSSRGRMLRQLITESLLLAAAGGAAGIALAVWIVKALVAFLPSNLSGYGISASPDWQMLAYTFALSLITGIVFGLAPALQATRPDIAVTLKGEAANVTSAPQVNFRKILVASQVALSLLLLIGAGLFIRSLGNLRLVNPGFRTSNLVQFSLSPRTVGFDRQRTGTLYQRLEERLRGLPGIRATGFANIGVMQNNEWDNSVTIAGYTPKRGEDIDPHFNQVTPGYFETLGIHVLAGRTFTVNDTENSRMVAVVNESFAKRYFGTGQAVGHMIGLGSDPNTPTNIEIIGVVNDTSYEGLRHEIPRQVYLADAQHPGSGMTGYVRTARDPENAFRQIRAAVHEIAPNLPITGMKTLEKQIDESLVTERMVASLSAAFGALATALAIIGLYGVMAYMVTRRSREIGIRMALGAMTGNVVWLVMREVLALIAIGFAAGIPAALALGRIVENQLYGVKATDPAAIALSTVALAAVAALAGFAPARRAARYDPVQVLRSE
jgi:predicted permease